MPTNPIATCKFHTVRCGREEAIAKPWPDEQVVMQAGCMAVNQAYQADKLAESSEVQKEMASEISKAPFIFLIVSVLIRQGVLFLLNMLFPPLEEPVFLNRFEGTVLRIQVMNTMESILSVCMLVFLLWTLWNLKDVMGNPSAAVLKKLLGYYACTIAIMYAIVGLFSILNPSFQGDYFYRVCNISFFVTINTDFSIGQKSEADYDSFGIAVTLE